MSAPIGAIESRHPMLSKIFFWMIIACLTAIIAVAAINPIDVGVKSFSTGFVMPKDGSQDPAAQGNLPPGGR